MFALTHAHNAGMMDIISMPFKESDLSFQAQGNASKEDQWDFKEEIIDAHALSTDRFISFNVIAQRAVRVVRQMCKGVNRLRCSPWSRMCGDTICITHAHCTIQGMWQ